MRGRYRTREGRVTRQKIVGLVSLVGNLTRIFVVYGLSSRELNETYGLGRHVVLSNNCLWFLIL